MRLTTSGYTAGGTKGTIKCTGVCNVYQGQVMNPISDDNVVSVVGCALTAYNSTQSVFSTMYYTDSSGNNKKTSKFASGTAGGTLKVKVCAPTDNAYYGEGSYNVNLNGDGYGTWYDALGVSF